MDGVPVIWWARRDLRLDDNPALMAALETGRPVIPVLVWAPEEEGQFQQGRYSRWWTKYSVVLFQQLLEQMGSRLIIRRASETSRGLMQVVNDTGATAVFFNHLYDPISLVRDHEVKSALTKLGIECKSYNADLLYEPWDVLDSQCQPFTSFASFWSRVLDMPSPPPFPLPAPARLPAVPASLFSVEVQQVDWFMTPEQEASSEQLKFKWRPGVEGAVEKVEEFLSGQLHTFEHDRAKVDRHSTSQLSPWVHVGTISVRYIFYRVCQRQAELRAQGHDIATSCKDYLQQLGYREYSRYLSFHFPFIHERTLLAHLRACPWRMDQQHFKAWRQGQTGYPLIDAAMRELWSTGWCHNRMRVVAASFMVKNLLLPWQWGLKHFWDAQMDADLECDALGWQYVSGGMADAHPFDYMIDLEQEAKRFDPDGEYVRRWLPVLSRLPTKYIHAPWNAPPQVLAAADVELSYNYPERIITLEESVANMARACQVLQTSVPTSSGRTAGSYPYRPPTMPASETLKTGKEGSGDGSRPSQAHGTGTGTCYERDGAADPQPPAQQAPRVGGKRPAADMGAIPRCLMAFDTTRPAGTVGEAGSVLLAPPAGHAERARQRAAAREGRRAAAAGAGGEGGPEWVVAEGEGEGEDEVAAPALAGAGMQEDDAMSSSTSGALSDAAMSEEVVSNTVGLSAPQPTAWSGLPEQDDEQEAASGAPRSRRAPAPTTHSPQQQQREPQGSWHAKQQPPSAVAGVPTVHHPQLAGGGMHAAGSGMQLHRAGGVGAHGHHPCSGSNRGTNTPLLLSLQTGTISGPNSGVDTPGQGQVQGQRHEGRGASSMRPAAAEAEAAAGQQQGACTRLAGDATGRLLPQKRLHSPEKGPMPHKLQEQERHGVEDMQQ